MMEYRGYQAQVEYDDEAEIFHGEVLNVRDVITFQGRSVRELRKALKDSVEDYLAFCEERGEEPDRPFSGNFSVRLTPELHRRVFTEAKRSGKSLNRFVTEALSETLKTS